MCEKEVIAYAKILGGYDYPNIKGCLTIKEVKGGSEVSVELYGLPPYIPTGINGQPVGPLGFHIHEKGLCEITNPNEPFQSAGGHYNPNNQPHGNHAGDLPVVFSNDGYSKMTVYTNKFTPQDVIGRSIMIHENPDDYRSQPAGDAGRRIACGIIYEL